MFLKSQKGKKILPTLPTFLEEMVLMLIFLDYEESS